MNKTWMFYVFALCGLISSTAFASEKYTLADLQVLADNQEYKEFFTHAKDILPSKRKEKWRRLVIDQSKSYVDNLRKTKDFKLSSWNEVESISSWTQLKYDDFFQIKRNGYAKVFFENCFIHNSSKVCADKMQTYWRNSNRDADVGFHFAKLSSGMLLKNATWTFVTDIIKSDQGHFYCDKPLITEALSTHLQTLSRTQVSSFKGKVKLQNMATSKCWNKMIPSLKVTLKSLPANESSGLYFALSSLKQLSQLETDVWLTRYLLSKPNVGVLFNQAWNRVKLLGSDFKRRDQVLLEITALNLLPDDSFRSSSKAITSHLSRYFPEYISHYARTCLDYLEGTKVFEFGNPTPSCSNLFKSKSNQFISRSLRDRYGKAKRL